MKSISVKLSCILFLISMTGMWTGCKTNDLIAEPAKNIEGAWKIDKVIRNDEDITERINVNDFQLLFQKDTTVAGGESGSYKITNGAPFVVSNDGSWALNDPAYPFYLSLTPKSTAKPVQVKFYFPVIEGRNEIKLIFSPGCTSNTYQYLLKKVSK